jgi:hypothetical protein
LRRQKRCSAKLDAEAETSAEEGAIRVDDLNIHRARMDIRHLKMTGLPFHPGKEVVVIAKHLCGVATDLALRGLAQCCAPYSSTVGAGGVVIATCCHHACVMQDYVSSSWLARECGINCAEFETMRRWTGWTTLTKDVVSNNRNQQQNDGENGAGQPLRGKEAARKRTRGEQARATNDDNDDADDDDDEEEEEGDDQNEQSAPQDGEARGSQYSEEYTRILAEIS